jgi:hypothetical protein
MPIRKESDQGISDVINIVNATISELLEFNKIYLIMLATQASKKLALAESEG